MLKKLLMTTCLFAMSGFGIAVAAENAPSPSPPPPQVSASEEGAPPQAGPRPFEAERGPMHGPGPGGQRPHADAPPPAPPSPGAHFVVDRGPLHIDIKCADTDNSQACADAASKLIDKLAAMPEHQPPQQPAKAP